MAHRENGMGAGFLRSFGFALDRTWMNCLFLMPLPLVGSDALSHEALSLVYMMELAACSATLAVALALAAFLASPRLSDSRLITGGMRYCGGACAFYGIVLFAALSGSPALPEWLLYVSGALTGVGEGILILQWGCCFAATNSSSTGMEVCASFILGGIFPILITSLIGSAAARFIIVALAPLLSAWLLRPVATPNEVDAEGRRGLFSFRCEDNSRDSPETQKVLAAFSLKLFLATFLLSFMMSSLRLLDKGELFGEYYIFAPTLAGVLCLVIFCWQTILDKHYEYRFTYRMVMTLVFLGTATLFLLDDYRICDLIARIGLFCFEILFFTMAIKITSNLRVASIQMIAAMEFGYMFSELAGTLLVWRFPETIGTDIQSLWINLAMLASLFLIYTYILTENDIVDAESWGFYRKANEGASVQIRAKRSVPAGPENRELGVPGAASDADTDDVMSLATEIVMSHARKLAEERGLSPREVEIATYLALGYSRGQIQKRLYISPGTVNTHISHIYQKLDIHSRDDLQSLLDQSAS